MVALTVPFPPSVNNLFMNAKNHGRILSTSYKAWRDAAHAHLVRQPFQCVRGQFVMTIRLQRPDKRRRDCSNYIKALEDFLVERHVLPDDSECQRVTIEWLQTGVHKPALAFVEIEPYAP